MWTVKFWRDAAERVLATAAQAGLGALATLGMIQRVDWAVVGGTAALAGLLALLKALVASQKGDPTSASLIE